MTVYYYPLAGVHSGMLYQDFCDKIDEVVYKQLPAKYDNVRNVKLHVRIGPSFLRFAPEPELLFELTYERDLTRKERRAQERQAAQKQLQASLHRLQELENKYTDDMLDEIDELKKLREKFDGKKEKENA